MDIPLELFVTVICKDGNCKIPLAKLMSMIYFKKMLSGFNTKILFEEHIITENSVMYTKYEYEIPHLKVNLTTEMFKFLVSINGKEHGIYSFDDEESILEIMMNVDFYQINCEIAFRMGFNAEKEFHFIEYVKTNLPHLNAFDVVKNGNFSWYSMFIERAFYLASEEQLSMELSNDLINYLEHCVTQKWNVNDHHFTFDIVIKSIKHLYKYCKNNIKMIVTTETIKSAIDNYVEKSKSYCENAKTWGWHDVKKDYVKFNEKMTIIFNELVILNELGLIDLNEIGDKESYKIE